MELRKGEGLPDPTVARTALPHSAVTVRTALVQNPSQFHREGITAHVDQLRVDCPLLYLVDGSTKFDHGVNA